MAGMVYSVQLLLNVDSKQLDEAQRKLQRLRRQASRGIVVRERGGGGSASGGAEGFFSRRNWSFRYSQRGFMSGLDAFQSRWKTFSGNFFQNLFTISGWGRNLGNASRALFSFTGILGKAVPAIGALTTVAIGLAKMWAFTKIGSLALNGIPLWAGTRLLQSNSMGEAASNIMQMRMAEKGLGGYYKPALDAATEMAAAYGFDRVGMLNAINAFSGLPVNGRALGLNEARKLAEIAGKISHLGGLSFERVNVNLQQLLSQAVPSVRDIRELVGQAPFIGKLAQLRMQRKGVSGDYREWLKDKVNLIETLAEFDKLVETNPLMKARGRIALAKQDFHMNIANTLAPYWDSIAKANQALYTWIGKKVDQWFGSGDPAVFERMGNRIVGALDSLIGLIEYFGKKLLPKEENKELVSKAGNFSLVKTFMPTYSRDLTTGMLVSNGGTLTLVKDANKYTDSLYNLALDSVKLTSLDSLNWIKAWGERADSVKNTGPIPNFSEVREWALENKKEAFIKAIPSDSTLGHNRTNTTVWSPGTGMAITSEINTPFNVPNSIGWTLSPDAFAKFIQDRNYGSVFGSLGSGASGATDETARLSDLSNGSKALIINFNKEIVNMPVNIESASDVEDIANRLQPRIEESIIRGLEIALNNASGMT